MSCRKKSHRATGSLEVNLTDLDETGRLHFFYHSPSSPLPVRDVLNEQGAGYKTEPYIEKCAENYCRKCNPASIRGFLKSRERYLFLFTTCRDNQSKRAGKVLVVGYIEKEHCELRPGGFYAVIGPTKLVSFDKAYNLGESASDNNPRQLPKKCDARKTGRILRRLGTGRNILRRCQAEVKRLKERLSAEERKEQARRCS
jgi:hypothetical protein